MKRFMAFSGYSCYASGGALDFVSDHDKKEEAVAAAKNEIGDDDTWWHVLDTDSMEIIAALNGSHCGYADEKFEDQDDD